MRSDPAVQGLAISIHAPREGCDYVARFFHLAREFQSTHPVRGATELKAARERDRIISIHAPREGCDVAPANGGYDGKDFNPRTP